MPDYTLYQYLWFFVIYAFIGWCTEVVYAASKSGKFVNRGFLNGPYCPIYGFGLVIVISTLTSLKDNLFLLFAGSMILTSALEVLTGFVLKKVFHQTWWDYSDQPFNIGGYICLRFSLIWGIACVLVIYVIHPMIVATISWIPQPLDRIILFPLIIIIAVDFAVTVDNINKLNRRLSRLDDLVTRIRDLSDELGENLAEGTMELLEIRGKIKVNIDEKRDTLLDNIEKKKEIFTELTSKYEFLLREKSSHTRLLKAFPNLKSTRYAETLQKLKEHYGIFKK
ncbi:MAG: putative ABC transporter permease [Bacillota bacterium]